MYSRTLFFPLILIESIVLKYYVYSGNPTPPECRTIGRSDFLASKRTARTLFTPPKRQASIWHTSIPPDTSSCLNITRV